MKKAGNYIILILIFLGINFLTGFIDMRFDLTEDRRYSLSKGSIRLLENFDSPVIIDVLLDGELPSEFQRLQTETIQLLKEFKARNSLIEINVVNPLENENDPQDVIAELQQLGLTPANVTTEENNRVSQEIIFPWAVVSYRNSSEKAGLLINRLGMNQTERINNSVQNLEFAFANALSVLQEKERSGIAVITGNGELEDIYLADLLTSLNTKYAIGKVTLDSVAVNPEKTLEDLQRFDLALIAKPTEAFSESEKLVLDQFIVNGGKTLWFLDKVAMEIDSLLTNSGEALAIQRDLNLDDFLFRFGIRINPDLVQDLICTQIVIATGETVNSQYSPVPWYYHPMVFPDGNHPLTTNIDPVRFQFANSLDTLPNNYKKTILYKSSPKSSRIGVPRTISLEQITEIPDEDNFSDGSIPLAVLIEGAFSSAYSNRVLPFKLENYREKGEPNKLVVIADGDFVKNQLRNGRPLELGYDKWTNNYYGNKDFIINTIDYLMGKESLINIRSKKISIPLLDQRKIASERTKWQALNLGLPLLVLTILVFGYRYFRRLKYTA